MNPLSFFGGGGGFSGSSSATTESQTNFGDSSITFGGKGNGTNWIPLAIAGGLVLVLMLVSKK